MRSGTTLTASILNAHPEVCLVSDKLTWFFNEIYYPGMRINTEYKYRNILYKMKPYLEHHGNNFSIVDVVSRSVDFEKFGLKDLYKLMIELELGKSIATASAFGIKATHSADRYEDIIGLFPESRIIHMVRDVHDVCFSHANFVDKRFYSKLKYAIKKPKKSFNLFKLKASRLVENFFVNSSSLDAVYKNPLHFVEPSLMIDYWIESNKKALKLAKIYPDNILIVKYEDLISDNENAIKNILEFCSLNHHSLCFDYENLKDREDKKWEANSSFSTNVRGYDITRIGRGKSQLDTATLELIQRKGSVVMNELKY